jgi:hypothetical protein
MRRGVLGTAVSCALLIGACGGSSQPAEHASTRPAHEHHPHLSAAAQATKTTCLEVVRVAFARFLHAPPSAVSERGVVGNDASPQCTFTLVRPAGRIVALANVYDGPSPYFILERTEVEAAQVFGETRPEPTPVPVTRLGIEADWFPGMQERLMATDGKLLITTTVRWRGSKAHQRRALAIATTRPYLHTPHGKAAIAAAEGYPSS